MTQQRTYHETPEGKDPHHADTDPRRAQRLPKGSHNNEHELHAV